MTQSNKQPKQNVLVTGASGMLGRSILRQLIGSDGNITSVSRSKVKVGPHESISGDLTDFRFLDNLLETTRPDLIFHCAANVHVDACEGDPKGTRKLHVDVTNRLSRFNPSKTKIVYISTDAVYDGSGDHKETDVVLPKNIYTQTKLEGEKVVQKENPNHLILRTNLFGFHPNEPLNGKRSISEWGLSEMLSNKKIKGFTDVFFNPLYSAHLAHLVVLLSQTDEKGIVNVGASGQMSKFDFLVQIAKQAGLASDLVEPFSVDQMGFAERPKKTTVNITKLKKILPGVEIPSVDEGIRVFYRDFKEMLK
ncbi:MAG: NAD(P)-dependent oxidoreductase [Bacteriovoracia bacterium]